MARTGTFQCGECGKHVSDQEGGHFDSVHPGAGNPYDGDAYGESCGCYAKALAWDDAYTAKLAGVNPAIQLQAAAIALAARDEDHAFNENGVGFNKSDTWYGHSIAALAPEEWTPEVTAHAYRVLRKYTNQLSRYGIDFDVIPAPDLTWTEQTREEARSLVWDKMGEKKRKLSLEDAQIKVTFTRPEQPIGAGAIVEFPFDRELVDAVKRIPGRKWDGTNKFWTFPDLTAPATRAGLAAFVEKTGAAVNIDMSILISVDEVEEATLEASRPSKRIELTGDPNRVDVIFPYEPALKDRVKAIPGARFSKEPTPRWTVPVRERDALVGLAKEHGFVASEQVHAALESHAEDRAARREASAATQATLDLSGFGVTPYPFQLAGIQYALEMKRTFIADEMGLGKTTQAMGVLHQAQALPALVVCPNNVLKKWARELLRALPGVTVSFLNGKPGSVSLRRYDGVQQEIPINDLDADVLIVNYDKLPRWIETVKDEQGNVVKKHNRATYRPVDGTPWAGIVNAGTLRTLILDESHYVKNRNAKRTAALDLIARTVEPEYRLALSGTPILNRPNELIEQLRILNRLDDLGGSGYFLRRYCAGHRTAFGYDASGSSNLPELHDRLREIGYVRRLKRDVLIDLPAKQRDTIELPITNREEYDKAELHTIQWLRDQAISQAALEGLDMDEAEQQAQAKITAALRAEILTRMNLLRKLAAIGVVENALDWIREFLDSNEEKIVVWAYHKEVQTKLLAGLAEYNPVAITAGGDKDAAQHTFQTDPECRVIVCSISAGREGIELTAASTAAFVELEWRPGVHDQAEDRCYGRLDDPHGMNAYYLLAEDSIYGHMAGLIDAKRDVVDAATDGKVGTTGASILGSLVGKLLEV